MMIKYCYKYWLNDKLNYSIYHSMTPNINDACIVAHDWNSDEQRYPNDDKYTYIVIECEDHK